MSELTREQLENYRVDRTGWSAGEWGQEPDRAQWTHAGYACLITRHDRFGSLCGYVGIDAAHPCYEKRWSTPEEPFGALRVHGGVNYSAHCAGIVCHAPAPGMPERVWWVGFECAHAFDISPGLDARERALGLPELPSRLAGWCVYRNWAYVKSQVESLAEQLRALR